MQKAQKTSQATINMSTRLSTVQVVYQTMLNPLPIDQVIQEHLNSVENYSDSEGGSAPPPDPSILVSNVEGVYERRQELESLIKGNLKEKNPDRTKPLEPLLRSILLCGVYELLMRSDVDTPIIINDYLDVTHGFYSRNEVSFVNGVLDSLASVLRA